MILHTLFLLKLLLRRTQKVIKISYNDANSLKEKDETARKTLFFNRFGAPTRPLRTMEDMMTFLAGSAIFDQLADFLSYNQAMDINTDVQKGLDSWMGEEDKQMLAKYQESIKNGGGGGHQVNYI